MNAHVPTILNNELLTQTLLNDDSVTLSENHSCMLKKVFNKPYDNRQFVDGHYYFTKPYDINSNMV